MATPQRDPITCHVLDTTTGRPAPGMSVTLTPLSPSPSTDPFSSKAVFTATTNSDGRIANWENSETKVESILSKAENSIWVLEFDTDKYYNGNTFWPKVQLTFKVKTGEHYHVPLLLGPYSYTTYRGS